MNEAISNYAGKNKNRAELQFASRNNQVLVNPHLHEETRLLVELRLSADSNPQRTISGPFLDSEVAQT